MNIVRNRYNIGRILIIDVFAIVRLAAFTFVFGLTGATDEALEEWDAYDLDEVPTIKDFKEDFEPYSPYDEGWSLNVHFVDPSEY